MSKPNIPISEAQLNAALKEEGFNLYESGKEFLSPFKHMYEFTKTDEDGTSVIISYDANDADHNLVTNESNIKITNNRSFRVDDVYAYSSELRDEGYDVSTKTTGTIIRTTATRTVDGITETIVMDHDEEGSGALTNQSTIKKIPGTEFVDSVLEGDTNKTWNIAIKPNQTDQNTDYESLPEDEWASEEVSEDNQAEIVYCYNGDTLANEIKLSKSNSVSLKIQNENIEGLTNTEFNTEAYENLKGFSFEGAKSKNREVDINDIKKVRDKNCEMIDYFQEDITITSNKITDAYTSINPLTKEELKNKGYSVDDLNEYFFEAYKKLVNNKLNSIVSNLNNIISENIEIDNNESSVRKREYNSYTPSGGGSSSDTPSSNPNETINNIEKVPNYDEVMTKYSSVMVATILFNEITPLFEKIGDTTSIQSVQDSEIYKLMGIVKSEDGKYYYQVIDSNTGRIYLADINSNVTLKWDELGERKAVEVVGDSAFVLKSTNEGDNMLERVASKGDVYLVNGDKINVDGIDYYSINDNETGNTAFMPVSDSITDPKLIGEIIKPVVGEVAK